MFSAVARLRRALAASVFLASVVLAREEVLFTSSISYCEPPESILINQFDITYFASNTSVSFNISAASVSSINATANLLVNVYGMSPLNYTLDLCNIFGGALCPLPTYNFIGADSITLPASVDVASHVPGIAYKMPDLEAFAQLILTDSNTGEVKACVQATLSNGWSARQSAVGWATGGLALLAFASAFWHSVVGGAMAPVRLLDLMSLYQTIAASGLYAVNFPSVYRAYALNFAWSLGLFHSNSIQSSITSTRGKTGGHVAATVANTIGLINRKISPWNIMNNVVTQYYATSSYKASQSLVAKFNTLPVLNLGLPTALLRREELSALNATNLVVSSAGEVQTVTSDSENVLNAGIPIYANSINIPTANAFMTVFIIALILLAIALGVLALTYAIVSVITRNRSRPGRLDTLKNNYLTFAAAWGVRIALITFLPITVFTFFQWTLKDSWLPILLSVFALLIIVVSIALPSFRAFLLERRSGATALPAYEGRLDAADPLYAPHRPARWYASYPTLLVMLVKALVIGLAKNNGKVQVIVTLVFEFLLFIALIVLKPAHTRRGDALGIFLALVRVFAAGLNIAFIESLKVKAIPRVVIGVVLAVIFSVAVVIMFFDVVRNLGLISLFRRRRGNSVAEDAPLNKRQESDLVLEKDGALPQTPKRSADERDETLVDTPLDSPQRLQPLDYRINSA